MDRALLYQPGTRWRIGTALGAAVLIHFAAIALANITQHEQTSDFSPWEASDTTITFDPPSQADDPTPPPDMVDPPTPSSTDESILIEERSTPPPVRPQTRPTIPIMKGKSATIGSTSLFSARVSALSAPRLEYPYEARRQKVTGSGTVVLTVDPVSGNVTGVVMETSTGSPVLDNAAITGFRRWRFKPGTALKIRAPITYTLTGAGY